MGFRGLGLVFFRFRPVWGLGIMALEDLGLRAGGLGLRVACVDDI